MKATLEAACVEFATENGGAVGVRLRLWKQSKRAERFLFSPSQRMLSEFSQSECSTISVTLLKGRARGGKANRRSTEARQWTKATQKCSSKNVRRF
jgi:hypothetical protein